MKEKVKSFLFFQKYKWSVEENKWFIDAILLRVKLIDTIGMEMIVKG